MRQFLFFFRKYLFHMIHIIHWYKVDWILRILY
ncbi:hypothetical protein BGLA2_260089 [Burkholderia gladioli]|nr:hypothetical protein BGLA2_260089 [Burkholderia gladioli]